MGSRDGKLSTAHHGGDIAYYIWYLNQAKMPVHLFNKLNTTWK